MTSLLLLDRRLFLVRVSLVLAFAGLASIFAYIQMIQGNRYVSLSQENRIRRVWIPAPRGKILDCHGAILVDNRPSFDISLEYEALKERKTVLEALSQTLHMTTEEIDKILKNYRGFAYLPIPIKKDVDVATLTQIEESRFQMPWVTVEVNPVRKYVLGETACSVLGYVSSIDPKKYQTLKDRGYHWLDVIGKSGVEASCEAYLKGESGGMQVEVNHRGRREKILSLKKPIPGRDVYLTIDLRLQKVLEEILVGRMGAGLVMNPKTGEILAVVSKPSYDLNIFTNVSLRKEIPKLFNDPSRPLLNKAFQGLYGPGSIFKLVVAAAGLETGLATENDFVQCQGVLKIGGAFFRCWKEGGHGDVSLFKAIKYSCNVFFYYLGQRLGPDRIASYAKRFGLGGLTGLDVGYEREGLIPTVQWKKERLGEPWYGGDTANLAIGQGFVTVTPVQMAVLVSAIANGGKLLKPFLVKKVVLPEGRKLIEVEPKVERNLNIPEWILAKIRKAMWSVVNDRDGTGHLSFLGSVEICGKTGTVQVLKGDEIKKNGWFVSFAPYENPQLVVILVVEGVHSGGQDVAPLARKVYERYFVQ